jgi:dephospho-CoA kinase
MPTKANHFYYKMRRHPVIIVSGKIASGKTTFAKALASENGYECVGFGDEVRSVAEGRGLPLTRETLQAIGEELVTNAPETFCEAVLARGNYRTGSGLVIEGLRHASVLTLLRVMVAPDLLIHVHILSSDELRHERYSARAREGDALAPTLEQHSTESQLVRDLPESADVLINSNVNLDIMISMAKSKIHSLS